MMLYLCRMCQCGLHVVLWSQIGILMRIFAAETNKNKEPRSTAGFLFHFMSVWYDLADPVFDSVELAGFKSQAIAFLLA